MKIGILQTGKVPGELGAEHGDYPDMFGRWLADPTFTFETYPVVDNVFPDGPDQCDAWLITGSKHGVYEPHDWIPPLEVLIRQACAASTPMIGVCFGHQIMAQALGGSVEKFSGGWSVGVEDYAIDNIGHGVRINAWHQDQVVTPPKSATVVASSPTCRYAALSYGDWGFSIQPHPEFTADFMAGLLEARGDVLPEAIARKAAVSMDRPTSVDQVATFVKSFLKRAFIVNAGQVE
ncbi:MAG: type 1 glutamine amidotransferase [Geminicoccaceae bacterium]